MQCYVYRSRRKQGSFLFLPERDNFARIPEVLLTIFGVPEFSFEFFLDDERQLQFNIAASEVRRVMQENGFFLQLPPNEELSC